MTRLELLGPPRRCADGLAQPLAWQRPTALLAYLACQPDWVSRDALATLLRPDFREEQAKAYLRRLLYRLKDLGLDAGLQVEPQRVRWTGSADVRELADSAQARDWQRVIELYRGPLLDGTGLLGEDGLDAWFEAERERLRTRWRVALTARIDELIAAGARASLPTLMQRLVDDDQLDEDGVQFLLRRAAGDVERRIALAAFDTLQRRLAYEMALRPLPITQELAAGLRRQAPVAVATRPAAAAPAEAAPFLGRSQELDALHALFDEPGTRIVTLLGPGGIGKTRLARQLLAQRVARDGVQTVFVDLRDALTETQLLRGLAEALEVPQREGALQAQLRDALAARRALVVLDNFEQLLPSAALVAQLAAAAPGMQWLLTSREPLGIAGEHRFELAGLPAAGGGDAAVELFVLHARRLGYTPTLAEREAIARIGRLVEGSPLAIELAATWVPVMTPAEIAAEMARDLGFLASDAPDRPDAHRSLRTVFESSWRLLTVAERRALAALTVFSGFERTRATEVAGVDATMLLRLAGKSLLRRIDARRFGMHAQVAAFAAEHLDAETRAALCERHAQAYLGWLAQRTDLKPGTHPAATLAAVRADFDNLRAAWRHAVERGQASLVADALEPLNGFVFATNRFEEGAELFALAASAWADGSLLARTVERSRCACLLALGRVEEVAASVEALYAAAAEPAERAHLSIARASIAGRRGQFEAAGAAMREAAVAAEASADPYLRVRTRLNLGVTEWSLGRTDTAEELYLQALAETERLGADTYRARTLRALGIVRHGQGRYDEARALMRASLALFEQLGDAFDAASSLRNLGLLCAYVGDAAAALDYTQRALEWWQRLGAANEIGDSFFALGFARLKAGEDETARSALREALGIGLKTGYRPLLARSLAALGYLRAGRERARGLAWLGYALAHAALRQSDRPLFEGMRDALGATDDEMRAAQAPLRDAGIEALAAEVLAAD